MSGTDFKLLYCVFPDLESAQALSKKAVTKKFAACANILPQVESIYLWQDQVESSAEMIVIYKTHSTLIEPLKAWLTEAHPYEVPCLLSFEASDVNLPYMQWLQSSLDLNT